MSEIKIIDNFTSNDNADQIESTLLGYAFPWYLGKSILSKENNYQRIMQFVKAANVDFVFNQFHDHKNLEFNDQLVHIFVQRKQQNSDHFKILIPLVDKINASLILRIKANLHWKSSELMIKHFHVDSVEDHITAIYYVNTNDGYTIFEDGTKIKSVKNRLVLFPSHLIHTGTNCTDSDYRCIINFLFQKFDYINIV